MNVNETVLNAIELLAKSKVEKADFDRTIQAQIISCEDAAAGKYRCRFQDAIIYAYANSPDVTFSNGSFVYILVPGNDMTKEKTILGSVSRLGTDYLNQVDEESLYDIDGENCIIIDENFYLDTSNKDYKYVIYKHGEESDISLDQLALSTYIEKKSYLMAGATFKTSIAPQRQTRGHYGITYNLRFLDNTLNRQVIRSYTIDEDNMVDNPYRLAYETRQYQIFPIDGQHFIRIESIEIFNKDFPNANGIITDRKLTQGDIQISKLQFFGVTKLSQQELNGLAVSLRAEQGNIFRDDATVDDYKTLTAQVKIKGRKVAINDNFSFYWGRENASILSNSMYYNKHLGRGWQCLNNSNVIEPATATTDAIIEWVPAKNIYKLGFAAATAEHNKIKVAVFYNGNVASKQIDIRNLGADRPKITIESDSGTKFYYDMGHPTLTCKVNGIEVPNYKYYWGYNSDNQVFESLEETTEQNSSYDAAVAALTDLQDAIAAGTKFKNQQAQNLIELEDNVNAFKYVQRVKENKIYNVQINNIIQKRTFKCSVFNGDIYLGTASITLENTLSGEDLYSLVINNGTQVFQYNENGVAPNSKSLDTQQEILPLSFTIYDNLGKPIEEDVLANLDNCEIRWGLPIVNTMLTDSQENGVSIDEDDNYKYYDKTELFYHIEQKYNIQKQRNQIKLTVDYKGLNLTAETNFTFAKQGEPGTNGTEYIVKLVPNTTMNNPPAYPVLAKIGSNRYALNYGLGTSSSETILNSTSNLQFFKAQLWHSGELVWEGFSSADLAEDDFTQPTRVYWQILQNQYTMNVRDASDFYIYDQGNGRFSFNSSLSMDAPTANIIKCTIDWEGKSYYGTIPITTAVIYDEKFRFELKDYTGFRYVIYSSDGVTPQYDDSNPFEFICKEKIDNIWEDISLVSGSHAITYEVSAIGNYLSNSGSPTNSNLLEILTDDFYREGCEKNQWRVHPKSNYNGLCVNNAVVCVYKQNNAIIGKIKIPIHFLLNKYGLSHINAWDGNSIQIDDEGGFILSPQMGAGRKQNDNSFTGVLMGQVRSPDKINPQSGLFGYNSGARTFFLNSQNGSAIFGKSDNGQIIIDPTAQKAMIYSHNFWKSTNYGEDGLPIDYSANGQNPDGVGLLIDLTTPEIRFGSGKFSVNSQGILHAEGANISGVITATTLNLGNDASVPVEKVNGLQDIMNGYIKEDGVVGGPLPSWQTDAIYAVGNVVRDNGKIYKCILAHTSAQSNEPPNDTYWEEDSSLTTFVVSSNGLLTASNAIIYGTIYASAGMIGGLNLSNGILSRGTIGSNDSMFLSSTQDLSATIAGTSRTDLRFTIGSSFGVTNSGGLFANSGVIGPFSLGTSGLTNGSYITLSPSRLYVSNTPTLYKDCFYAVTNNGAYIGLRNGTNAEAAYFGYIPTTLDYSQVAPPKTGWGLLFGQSANLLVNTGNLNLIVNNGGFNLNGAFNKNSSSTQYRFLLNQTDGFEFLAAPVSASITFNGSPLTVYAGGRITISNIATSVMLAAQNSRFLPGDGFDEMIDLGGSNYKWANIYAKNATIQTSDKKQKDILGKISFAENLIMSLNPITFMWKNGDHRRKRMGFIAQDVAKICKNLNQNLSLVTASFKESNPDQEGFPYYGEQVDDNLLTWGLSYEQLIAPIVAVIQKQQKRIKELEDKINEN